MNPRISLNDLVARLESADHAIAYFNKPLPEPLLDGLRLLAGRRGSTAGFQLCNHNFALNNNEQMLPIEAGS